MEDRDLLPNEMSAAPANANVQSLDAKRSARYKRHLGLISVGMAPLGGVTLLISHARLDRLPVALQWFLVALAFGSALYLVGLFELPWPRPLWLKLNLYDPAHWWGFLLPVVNTVYVAAMASWGFAVVSGFLYLHGVGATAPERALGDPFNDSWAYTWNLLNAIPFLEIPQTLGWEIGFRFTDHVNPVLLLLYKLALIGPMIATGTLVWQDVRRFRSKAKDATSLAQTSAVLRPPALRPRGGPGHASPAEPHLLTRRLDGYRIAVAPLITPRQVEAGKDLNSLRRTPRRAATAGVTPRSDVPHGPLPGAACCRHVVRTLLKSFHRSKTRSPILKVSVYRPSDTNPYRDWSDSSKDRVWRPLMIVPVPWQQLGVPSVRWADGPSGGLVHSLRRTTCSFSRGCSQHPDPSAPLSALTPRLRTLSHPIIGIPSVPGSHQLTTSPADARSSHQRKT